ncbi:MAG: GNAT family N-acetyltransferase [Phenylobacterium sp.]|nr:MAG: GNAT family N-acetyltransferase [Phenylobacterium sp.]
MGGFEIRALVGDAATVARLAEILAETVAAGGSVHFMHPTPMDEAQAYWAKALAGAAAGDRVVLGGFVDGRLEGTVSLYLDTPPNQPFRAEIWKLMVAPGARRQGIARQLMVAAEALAAERGRTLLNLDTAIDGGASALYESLGWVLSGTIPDYAYKPQGGLTGTAIYYKRIGA